MFLTAELLLFLQKFKMVAAAILDFIFVQYFDIRACRTSNVIHLPNFVQICAIVNELWAIDEIQNAANLNLLFLSILVEWSISGGSYLHYSKISFIYVNQRMSYCCLCKNPRWRWIVILLDHPRSPFVHLKFPFQISCWSSAYFSRYRDSKISQIWLKMPIQAPKIMFWGFLTPNMIFYHRDPQKTSPYVETRVLSHKRS